MNFITYGLMYLFQKKSYESVKRYKNKIVILNGSIKRLTSENQSLLEMIEDNDKRHRDDMMSIKFQLEEVNDKLNEMQEDREKHLKELAHSTITIESLYKLIDEFLNRYPDVKLSEIINSTKSDV